METLFIIGLVFLLAVISLTSTFIYVNYITIKKIKQEMLEAQRTNESSFSIAFKKIEENRSTFFSKINTFNQKQTQYTNSKVNELGSKIYKNFDIERKQTRQY